MDYEVDFEYYRVSKKQIDEFKDKIFKLLDKEIPKQIKTYEFLSYLLDETKEDLKSKKTINLGSDYDEWSSNQMWKWSIVSYKSAGCKRFFKRT